MENSNIPCLWSYGVVYVPYNWIEKKNTVNLIMHFIKLNNQIMWMLLHDVLCMIRFTIYLISKEYQMLILGNNAKNILIDNVFLVSVLLNPYYSTKLWRFKLCSLRSHGSWKAGKSTRHFLAHRSHASRFLIF